MYKGCRWCKHFRFDGTCAAFDPGQIPLPIIAGEIKHTQPVKGQQNEIVYEYESNPEAIKQRMLIAIATKKVLA